MSPSSVCLGFFVQLKVSSINPSCVRGNSAGAMATSVTHCCWLSLFLSLSLVSLCDEFVLMRPVFSITKTASRPAAAFLISLFHFLISPSLSSQPLDCSWSTLSFLHLQAWRWQDLHVKIALKLSLVHCYVSEEDELEMLMTVVLPQRRLTVSFRLVYFNHANQWESVAHLPHKLYRDPKTALTNGGI